MVLSEMVVVLSAVRVVLSEILVVVSEYRDGSGFRVEMVVV